MISRKGLHTAARAAPRKPRATHTFEVPGQVPVTISRPHPKSKFYTVTYGKQITHNLWYEQACMALGSCLMHALGCEGFHDGNPDYELSGEEDHTRER